MNFKRILTTTVLGLAAHSVAAADIGVCVAQTAAGNPTYHGLMTTNTKLQCELQAVKQNEVWTAPKLYAAGWRLVQVVGGDTMLARGGKGPSPVYYFEREKQPAAKPKRRSIFGGSNNSGADEGSGLF